MEYTQLIALVGQISTNNKEGLYKDHDSLIRYWGKQCEIEKASREEARAGLELIDTACANVLAELRKQEKVLQP